MIIFSVRSLLSAIYALTLSKNYKKTDVCFLIVHEGVKGLNLSALNCFIRKQGYDDVYDINILSAHYPSLNFFNKFKNKFLYLLSLKQALKKIPPKILERKVDSVFYCGGSAYRLPFNWSNAPTYYYYEHGIGNTIHLVEKNMVFDNPKISNWKVLKSFFKKTFNLFFLKLVVFIL